MTKKNSTVTFSYDRDLAEMAKEMDYLITTKVEYDMPETENSMALLFQEMAKRLSSSEYQNFISAWGILHHEGTTTQLENVCKEIKNRASSMLPINF